MRSPRCDHLLSAAAELLDKAGSAAVTLRDVGRAIGVSHNAPYRHFISKQDLLASLIAREIQTICDNAGIEEKPPSAQTLILAFTRWSLAYPERFRLMILHWPDGESGDLLDARRRWDGEFMRAIESGQANGALPLGDPERLSCLIRSTTLGAIQHYLSAGGKCTPQPASIIGDMFGYLAQSRRSVQPQPD
jgi:AcrR family transcriptional regulator